MQHVLQAGLSAGLSAVSGFHSNSSPKVDPSFDGTASLMPQDWIPQQDSRITYKGKYKNVDAALISWGAWSWGDEATWHWQDEERKNLDPAWDVCKKTKQTFIVCADGANVHGSLLIRPTGYGSGVWFG